VGEISDSLEAGRRDHPQPGGAVPDGWDVRQVGGASAQRLLLEVE
jgi:hypothetical protein